MTSTEADTGEPNRPDRSPGAIALFRLTFPVAGLLLAALYIENTYGRIRLENLYYPYFIISVLSLFTLTVLIDELRACRSNSGEMEFIETIHKTLYQWRRSIGFTVVALAYIWLIEPIGFFIATTLGVIGVMIVGGRRNPIWITISTGIILIFVYVMFIQIMGLRPPTGPLGL